MGLQALKPSRPRGHWFFGTLGLQGPSSPRGIPTCWDRAGAGSVSSLDSSAVLAAVRLEPFHLLALVCVPHPRFIRDLHSPILLHSAVQAVLIDGSASTDVAARRPHPCLVLSPPIFEIIVMDLTNVEVKIEDEDQVLLLLCSLQKAYGSFVDTMLCGITWILDSGCTFQFAMIEDYFFTYRSIWLMVTCDIVGIGEVRIKSNTSSEMLLVDVRHVSGLKKNLISLGTLDKLGYKYRCQGGVIRIPKGALVVMKGPLQKSIYVVQGMASTTAIEWLTLEEKYLESLGNDSDLLRTVNTSYTRVVRP
ncbi:hypothetical protein CRG98_013520 [Punica granatum]|uniref:Retrovirus-related Pol polyprotein from transposon TNT 1-94-like beta-barrel domain-containing protein n=1 Tax=Punica granatum TaxID=22663 RepID=A0A2I0KC72_PUNGR|nr:hypothetical protein CRG98_013520 [Punica granatum]